MLLLFFVWVGTRSHIPIAAREAGATRQRAPAVQLFSTGPINVSASAADSRAPVMAVFGDTVHIVWEENGRVYHRSLRGGTWSPVRSVATGDQPSIAADAVGIVHAAFVNEFGGNYEIYYCRWNGTSWSLPRNVSNTSGVSSAPSLAVAPDGTLHVVWADNTPGYTVIYYAYWDGHYWINEPIPNAVGGAPAITVSADNTVHVVWQDRDVPDAPYEVYHARKDGVGWSLPENLSDSPQDQSMSPSLVTDGNGRTHVVWEEKVIDRYAVYYTWGGDGLWSFPEQLSTDAREAYLPSVMIKRGAAIYAAWDEGTSAFFRQRQLDGVAWSSPSEVIHSAMGVTDMQLAAGDDGRLHALWTQRVSNPNWDVFYAELTVHQFLPLLTRATSR